MCTSTLLIETANYIKLNLQNRHILHQLPSHGVACKYLQYHFDGDGKLNLTKNEDKEEGGEKRKRKKRNLSIWAKVQWSLLQCREMPFSLAKYL